VCISSLHPKGRFVTTLPCAILSSTLKDELSPLLSHPKGHNPLPFPEVVLKCSRKCSGYYFPDWLEVVVDWRLEGCYNPLPLPIVIHTLGKLLLLLRC
jgi:hypothetical protein